MTGRSKVLGLALALSSVVAVSQAGAQGRPIELGTAIGVSFDFGSGATLTTVSVPTSTLRVGFWMNDRISVEPNAGLTWLHASGESVTNFNAALALLYHFNADASRTRPYFTIFPGVNHIDAGGGSATQFFAGAGLGALFPLQERLAFRAEGLYTHSFSTSTLGSGDAAAARIGFSFFTH